MTLLPFPVADSPRDLTPRVATARTYLYSAPGYALANGLTDLRKTLVPRGDAEIRFWGGFAWGTKGIVFRRRAGVWSATKISPLRDGKPTLLRAPKSGWPIFWRRAEGLGIWTLPDEKQIKDQKGYSQIFDGYSNLVETQRDGLYRAYAYNNPQDQDRWRYAKPMAALDRLIKSEFPTWSALSRRRTSKPLRMVAGSPA